MGGGNKYRNSSSKRVNVSICGRVPSFYRNLCRYQVLYVVVLWLLSYVTRRKTPWTKINEIIWPKSGTLMEHITFDMFCAVKSLKVKLS